jgi:hypothetical protein
MISYFPVVTGSLVVLGNVSVSGSINTSGSITISGSITSASFASTASFVALAQSASNAVSAQTASFANTLTVAGNLTAQTLVVQTITSSIVYSSGSNIFGNNIANTQVMTGSVTVTGSLAVVTNGTEFQVGATGVNLGNALTDSHVISGSLRVNPNGLFISSSGNIGIGTISPSSILNPSSTPVITLRSTTAGAYPSHVLQYINGQEAGITLASSLYIDVAGDSTATNNNIIFRTTNTNSTPTPLVERMRITSAGNVNMSGSLILTGTTSQILQTVGNSISGDNVAVFYNTNASNSYGVYIGAGTGTNHALYITDYSRSSALFKVQGNGNVGIGTSSPGDRLTIATGASTSAAVTFWANAGTSANELYVGQGSSNEAYVFNRANQHLVLGTNNTERMRITSGGNVLIGTTTTPSGTKFYTALGDTEGFRFGNWQSYTYTPNNAWIAENTWFDGNFKRITTGYAYALYSDAASGFQIRVSGTSSTNSLISWLLGITVLPNGTVYNYNNSTTWQQTSDIKIKQNVRPISNVLDKITALNPTHFEYKNKPGQTKTGFIAQEFEQVFPGHVSEFEPSKEYKEYFEEGETMKLIDADLIPYLVKAIQELNAKFEEYKATHP